MGKRTKHRIRKEHLYVFHLILVQRDPDPLSQDFVACFLGCSCCKSFLAWAERQLQKQPNRRANLQQSLATNGWDTLYPALLFVTPSLSKSRPLPDQSDSLTPSVTSASAAAGRLSKLLDLVRVSSNNNNHRQVSQNSENFSLPDAYIHLSSLH